MIRIRLETDDDRRQPHACIHQGDGDRPAGKSHHREPDPYRQADDKN